MTRSTELMQPAQAERSAAADHESRPPAASPPQDGHEVLPQDLPHIGTFGVIALVVLFLAFLGGLFLLGYLPLQKVQAELQTDAARLAGAVPVASVIRPKRQAAEVNLQLPADIQSYQQTSIFPRTNGYLKTLLVDIGDHVKAGQLLTQIDAPEIDAQLEQSRAAAKLAEANLERARMDLELSQTTLEHWEGFAKGGGVTQQQLDEKRSQNSQNKAAQAAAVASLASATAETRRLEAMQSFERVTAPFDGVISARNYDVGALLSPGDVGSAKPLFQIDRTDTLRVFIKVPQAYATQVRLGQKAQLAVRNYPGRSFDGEVTRFAGAMDPLTRSLRVEVDVANPDGQLFGGMYGIIRLGITQTTPPFLVPTAALVYNASGLSLGIVQDGKAHFQKVVTGRDLGTEIEIVEGLTGREQVITNPGELIREGTEVKTVSIRGSGGSSKPA